MTGRPGLVADREGLAAVLDPFRRELLSLLSTPTSATRLAARLGTSRQRVNYHLRALEDAGLVELVEERPRRGSVERMLRRTVDRVVLDPTALETNDDSPAGAGVRGGAMAVVAGAADAVRGVTAAARDADEEGRPLPTATLDGTVRLAHPRAMRDLLEDVAAVLARHDTGPGGGLVMRVTTLAWPEPPGGRP